MPCSGKEELIAAAVSRLVAFRLEVLAIGETETEKEAAEAGGGRFLYFNNPSLYGKIQLGLDTICNGGFAEFVIILSPQAWINQEYIDCLEKECPPGGAAISNLTYHLHISNGDFSAFQSRDAADFGIDGWLFPISTLHYLGWIIADCDAPVNTAIPRRLGYNGREVKIISGPPKLKIYSSFWDEELTGLRSINQPLDLPAVKRLFPDAFSLFK